MENIEDVEKIIEDECEGLIDIYNNLYDEVSGEIWKRKRRLKIRLIIYILIYISILGLFILHYKEWIKWRRL